MSAVMIPTGISRGAINVRAKVSASKRIRPPIKADCGIKSLLSFPIILRAICGAIKPIKPITPEKAMASEVIRVTKISDVYFNFLIETPNVKAISSPAFRAL